MKKATSIILSMVMCFTLFLGGCGKTETKETKETKKTITVKDSKGKEVELPSNPKKVVIINNNVSEIICALGEIDKIVGISEDVKFPEALTKKTKVGKSFKPDIEKILELKPDLVIGYGDYIKNDSVEKMKSAGINFISIDCFKIETLAEDVKTLGAIFNKEDRAKEYVDFSNKYLDLVKSKVEKIKEEDRVTVYWEGYTDFQTVSKGTGGNEVINIAGGINIAGNEPVEYPKISSEYIVQKSPKVMIKIAKSALPFGYGVTDYKEIKDQRASFIKRPGFENINAVKNNKVYVISNEIATSTRSVVGVCYVAKWLYPDLFKDLNPEEIHKEMLKKFHGLEYKGTWVCE